MTVTLMSLGKMNREGKKTENVEKDGNDIAVQTEPMNYTKFSVFNPGCACINPFYK